MRAAASGSVMVRSVANFTGMTSVVARANARRDPTWGIFVRRPIPLIAPRLIVGLGPPGREHLPCLLEVGARLVEGGGGAGRVLARFRSRIEAAAPAPWSLVVRDAGPDGDEADAHVAVIDQPAFFASVVVSAASEGGHAAIEARASRPNKTEHV